MAASFSFVRRIYLSLYNWVVFIGWAQVLCLVVKTLRESSYTEVYVAVERPLQLSQTAAVLEIIHSLVGLVRSPVTVTLPQIGSRLFVTFGIMWSFPEIQNHFLVSLLVISWSITEIQNHFLVSLLVISWSITEIVRYSFFGMKEVLGFAPKWLMWLRYSTFLLLHPSGVTSEVGLMMLGLPRMKSSGKYCVRMPNRWNFSFDFYYAVILVLGIYIPGCLQIYSYLLGQRKKALSKSKKE